MNFKLIFIIILLTAQASGYEQLDGYVTDRANQITQEYRTLILEKITKIEKNTSIEIAVLTTPTLNGQTIERFSIDTAQGNGIGKKGKDNGLLITVAQKERKWRIEVGYGLEGTLTDAQAKIIGERYLKPELAAGNWGKGIYDTLVQIEREINKEASPEVTTEQATQNRDADAFILLVVIFMFGLLWLGAKEYSSGDKSQKSSRQNSGYSGSYHSSGRKDSEDEDSLESDTTHHSFYSGGYDSSDNDSSSSDSGGGGFGGGGFGGGGAGGGF